MKMFVMLQKLYPSIAQDLAASGKQVAWERILTRAWRELLGERGTDSIIVSIPQGGANPTAQAGQLQQLIAAIQATGMGGGGKA